MKKRGKRNIQINISNRVLYTLITLGIIAILGVGVYAYGTSVPATFGHSYNELQPCSGTQILKMNGAGAWTCQADATGSIPDPLQVSRFLTGEVTDGFGAGQGVYDVGANNIGAGTSIYSYGAICVGNSAGDCSGRSGLPSQTTGTLLTSSSVTTGTFYGSGADLTGVLKTETDPTVQSWAKTTTGAILASSLSATTSVASPRVQVVATTLALSCVSSTRGTLILAPTYHMFEPTGRDHLRICSCTQATGGPLICNWADLFVAG